MKLRERLPAMRRRDAYAALRAAFTAGCDRNGFRLVHYAVLNDHLHFVVEAPHRATLSRGVQGLLVRIARTLNRLWQRKGSVFADRYHDHVLKTPRDVRNVLVYVLGNAKHHEADHGLASRREDTRTRTTTPWTARSQASPQAARPKLSDVPTTITAPIDSFTSAPWFDGFREAIMVRNLPERPVTDARTWLLARGWRRHGLLSVFEKPA